MELLREGAILIIRLQLLDLYRDGLGVEADLVVRSLLRPSRDTSANDVALCAKPLKEQISPSEHHTSVAT
jgi:hypothetical protein